MTTKTTERNRVKKGQIKEFFGKLSRGLMLPIAILPIAGLFLGVGAGIENIMSQNGVAKTAGAMVPFQIMKMIGDVIFGNLPALFAIGIAIAFTEDAGVAALAAFVGWIVFNMTQNSLIWEYGNVQFDFLNKAGDVVSVSGADIGINDEYLRHFDLSSKFEDEWLGKAIAEYNKGQLEADYLVPENFIEIIKVQDSFGALWYYGTVPNSVIATNVGVRSMQTSVFGGIAIGLLVAFLYNKFHTFQMPRVLGFFSGTKFVPIITLIVTPILGMFFLMLWPIVGIGLDSLGQGLAKAPAELDTLAFGFMERILIPFGLHHAFYTPLWYSTVGGEFLVDGIVTAVGNQGIWFEIINQGLNFGDIMSAEVENGFHVFEQGGKVFQLTEGVNPGSYMQGKFPFMLFGLPAAGAAMIMAAKKENRQMAASIIGAAALTSFLTGITEPIEFTFLFLAPWLFFGFHAVLCAISFWVMALAGAHIGMTFSGGMFDLILFGLIPDIAGNGTNHWNVYWLGAIYIPVYYFGFYYAITKFGIATPGRVEGEISLKSKKDYQEKVA